MERRQHQRIPCRIPCEILTGKKTVAGFVQDISAGGLRVRVDIQVAEEDTFTLSLKVAPEPVVIHCMVWHTRQVRRPSTGERFTQLGLVLSQPAEEFMKLVARLAAEDSARKAGPSGRLKTPLDARTAPVLPAPPPVSRKDPAPTQSPRKAPVPTSVPRPDSAPASAPLPFAVRVKQDGGPRTRKLVVGGLDETDAKQKALVEIGPGWTILDVVRA